MGPAAGLVFIDEIWCATYHWKNDPAIAKFCDDRDSVYRSVSECQPRLWGAEPQDRRICCLLLSKVGQGVKKPRLDGNLEWRNFTIRPFTCEIEMSMMPSKGLMMGFE